MPMDKTGLLFVAMVLILPHCTGTGSKDLGIMDGQLTLCPHAPNCVSSQSQDESHYVDPLAYEAALGEATEGLLSVLRAMKRIRIVHVDGGYIRAECRSALFGFIDDLEFYFDDGHKTIHVRSASRVGYYDFGVNRRRVERIRTRFGEHMWSHHEKSHAK